MGFSKLYSALSCYVFSRDVEQPDLLREEAAGMCIDPFPVPTQGIRLLFRPVTDKLVNW